MKMAVNHKDELLLEEKRKRREAVAMQVTKRKAVEKKVMELRLYVEDLSDDIAVADHQA